jgi:hypothetical protein
MWRTRKCALGKSLLRMWRAASRVGWRDSAEMAAVRGGEVGLGGGSRGGGRVRMWVYRAEKVVKRVVGVDAVMVGFESQYEAVK